MNLSQLKPPPGQKHKKRASARVWASGRGKFSGRGAKGAKSISGYSRMRGFEGGQMPLHRRLPKRGFTNIFRKEYAIVNVSSLEKLEGDTFDAGKLLEAGRDPQAEAARAQGPGLGRAEAQDHGEGASFLQVGAGKNSGGRRHCGSDRKCGEAAS